MNDTSFPSFNRRFSLLLSIRYSLVLGGFWAVFCSTYSYATVYLLSKGFSSSVVGILLAVGNITGLLLQPVFASIADRSKRFSIHSILICLALAMMAVSISQYLFSGSWVVTALLFILLDALLRIMLPLTNALSFYYINRSIPIEYGIPRGTGSIIYAIVSSILGILVVSRGAQITMLFTTGFLILMVAAIYSMPRFPGLKITSNDQEKDSHNTGILSFFSRYPIFSITLIGYTAMYVFHNMSNTSMIYVVRSLGGDAETLGTLMSVQAMAELPAMFGITFLLRRFRTVSLMKCTSIFFTLKATAYLLSFNLSTLFVAQLFQAGAFALFTSTSVYYVNEIMLPQDKVKGQAFMSMPDTLGGVIGSLLGGFLIQYFGVGTMLRTGWILAASGTALVLFFIQKIPQKN